MTPPSASLAEQGRALNAASAGRLPADVVAAFDRSRAALIAGGVPSGVVAVGTPLPDVSLVDALGVTTSLFAVTGARPAVLVFYRGTWCPYCNLALHAYSEQLLAPLTERGIGLVAISPQTPDGSLSMQEKHALQFPVVSDVGNALAGRLGILMPSRPAEVRAAQEKLGLDLEAVNADGTDALPLPTVVLVDGAHVVRWIEVRPDYATRTEVVDILAAADAVLAPSAQPRAGRWRGATPGELQAWEGPHRDMPDVL